jgi:multiple sugar transport system substrate-binding protein
MSGAAAAACTVPLIGGSGAPRPLGEHAPMVLEFWGGPNQDQRQDQINAWQARFPNIKVHFRTAAAVGAGTEALRAYAANVAAKTAPHLMDFDRFQVAAYVNWRMFRMLDDFVRRDKYDLSGFAPAALGEARGLDRRLYGLPNSVDTRLLYWNKQHFGEAGLDPEKPPATWEDLRAAAVKLTRRAANGSLQRMGFHTQEGQSSLHLFAWQNGGGFQSADGKTATLPLPANREALAWMAGLLADQAPWPAAQAFKATWSTDPARNPFLAGQISMQIQVNNWAGETIAAYRPDMPFGVAPPAPRQAGDPAISWSGGFSYVMSSNAPDADVAWELAKWLVGEEAWKIAFEGERARAKARGGVYVPGMTGQPDLDTKLLAQFKTDLPSVDAVSQVALGTMPRTRFREPSIAAADLWEGVISAQEDAVSQAKSPAEALEQRNAAVQRALDQAWVFAPPK